MQTADMLDQLIAALSRAREIRMTQEVYEVEQELFTWKTQGNDVVLVSAGSTRWLYASYPDALETALSHAAGHRHDMRLAPLGGHGNVGLIIDQKNDHNRVVRLTTKIIEAASEFRKYPVINEAEAAEKEKVLA
jgi:hypothetical protein